MSAPNIVNVTTIIGSLATLLIPNTATAIISNSVGSNQVFKVNALYIGNIDTTTTYSVTIEIYRASTSYRVLPNIGIPVNSGFDALSKAIYLQEGDSLRLTASTTGKLEAICSYEVIS